MATATSSASVWRSRLARYLPQDEVGFARLAALLVTAMYLNVASGAFVRLTGSGLACPDWPLCHGRPVPPSSGHSVIEFSNRMVALGGIGVALVAAWASLRLTDRVTRVFAVAVAAGTLAQIPLGALTVLLDLNPILVMSHFLLAMSALGCSAIVWARASDARDDVADRPAWLPALGYVAAIAGAALLVSGALSTAAGPHSGGQDIRRMGNLVDATYIHVRVAAVYIALTAALLAILAWGRWRPTGAGRLGVALVVLIPLQAFIGEWQWRHQLPWGFVLAHVCVAAAAFGTTIALAVRVGAPVRRPNPARNDDGRPRHRDRPRRHSLSS